MPEGTSWRRGFCTVVHVHDSLTMRRRKHVIMYFWSGMAFSVSAEAGSEFGDDVSGLLVCMISVKSRSHRHVVWYVAIEIL